MNLLSVTTTLFFSYYENAMATTAAKKKAAKKKAISFYSQFVMNSISHSKRMKDTKQ